MRDNPWVIDYISFTCKYCSAPFEKPQDLIDHKKEQHLDKIGSRLHRGAQLNSKRYESESGAKFPKRSVKPHGQRPYAGDKHVRTLTKLPIKIKSRGQNYGCSLCKIKFTSFQEVVAHKKSNHPHLMRLVGEFNCQHCHAKYNDKKNYGMHLKRHRDLKLSKTDFPCLNCKKRFLSKVALQTHSSVYHDKRSPAKTVNQNLVSEQSDKDTVKSSKSESSTSMKRKINLPARYAEEGLDSDDEDDLPDDEPVSSSLVNLFKCKVCSRTYKNYRCRRKHERKAHNIWIQREKKSEIAPPVKIKFPERINTKKLLSSSPKRSSASTERRFTCHFCKQTFETMTQLLIHARIHGNNPGPKRSPKIPIISSREESTKSSLYLNRRQYPCKHCSQTFLSPSGLHYHKARKHVEHRLRCSECPASFIRKGQLKLHQLEHAGIKPHSCQFCDCKFTRHGILVRHTRKQHAAERRFRCTICANVTANVNAWMRHCRIHNIDSELPEIGE